jgi:NAD-specific glutamate dehydrogenase
MIDTHEAIKQLEAAGLTTRQAEVVTALLREVERPNLGVLATKSDLAVAIAEAKADIYKAMLAQTIVLVGAMVGLKLFG